MGERSNARMLLKTVESWCKCCLDYNPKNKRSREHERRRVKRSERNKWKRELDSQD